MRRTRRKYRMLDYSIREKRKKRKWLLIVYFSVFTIVACSFIGIFYYRYNKQTRDKIQSVMQPINDKKTSPTKPSQKKETSSSLLKDEKYRANILAQANKMVTQYNYEGALSLLKKEHGYESYPDMVNAIDTYNKEKSELVEWDINQTTHVFFHSLIADTKLAFDGDDKEKGYDMYMTTISEFNKMMESMYKKNYVLVTPHQLASLQKNTKGNEVMTDRKILLPKGKKAFILSIDDVSYYQYMDGDGFATRIVLDKNGKPTCEMKQTDGSVSIGDYDVVPLLERFIEKHPDFSYQGAKGIIALTGYDGVLGYRTSASQHRDSQTFLQAHPGYDFKTECANAKKVVEGMRQVGWLFASHSYSHNNIGQQPTGDKKPLSYKEFKHDTDMWEKEVQAIVGETDIIIFPQGTYLNEKGRADWKPYKKSNTHYKYLKEKGFRYFFGVGGYQPWVQLTKEYFRQDRINFDGVEMRNAPQLLKQFFDVKKVYDTNRPSKLK